LFQLQKDINSYYKLTTTDEAISVVKHDDEIATLTSLARKDTGGHRRVCLCEEATADEAISVVIVLRD